MNKERRKALSQISDEMDAMMSTLEEKIDAIQSLLDEEQEYFDNMPESLQSGEKGSLAEEVISALETAVGAAESAKDSIEELTGALGEAGQ